jgi:hypothetical protein
MVEDIQKQINSEGIVHVSHALCNMTIDLFCSLLFGSRYTDSLTSDTDELKHCPMIIRGTTSLFMKMNLGDLFPWLAWADIQGHSREYKDHQQLVYRVFGQKVEVNISS